MAAAMSEAAPTTSASGPPPGGAFGTAPGACSALKACRTRRSRSCIFGTCTRAAGKRERAVDDTVRHDMTFIVDVNTDRSLCDLSNHHFLATTSIYDEFEL